MTSARETPRYQALIGVVQLWRPINIVLSLAGVVIGAFLGAGPMAFSRPHLGSVILAAFSAASVTAAANAINDAFDVKVDRVNRPTRPIPAGKITERAATYTWLFGAILGIGLSLLLSATHVLIASAAIVVVYLYSAVLKRAGFIGNFAVSAIVASSIVYGALATGYIGKAWIGSVLAFLLTLAREITKDLEDVEGDIQEGANTLPVSIGHRKTSLIAVALIVVTIVAAPMPFLFFSFERLYLLGIAVTNFCLLSAIWYLWVADERKETYGKASFMLKSAMVAGLGALLLA